MYERGEKCEFDVLGFGFHKKNGKNGKNGKTLVSDVVETYRASKQFSRSKFTNKEDELWVSKYLKLINVTDEPGYK